MLFHECFYQYLIIILFVKNIVAMKRPFFLQEHHKSPNPQICEHFYDVACNDWKIENEKPPQEPLWNQFLIANYEIRRKVHEIMKLNWKENSMKMAQQFYYVCLISDEEIELKYLHQLKSLINTKFEGWPILQETNWEKHDWLFELSKIIKLFKIYPILTLTADLDYQNPKQTIIYIGRGNSIFPQYILLNPKKYQSELKMYKNWIFETVKHVNFTMPSENKINRDIYELIEFEMKMAKLNSINSKTVRIKFGELRKRFPENWPRSLFNLFGIKIGSDETIILKNPKLLTSLLGLLKTTKKNVIGNYLMWNVIKELSRETTNYMRKLNFLIDEQILGVKSDLNRQTECIDKVMHFFGYAIMPSFIQFHVPNNVLIEVDEMVERIRKEFVELIEKNRWLSPESKHLFSEKIRAIKLFVGYPDWITNTNKLNTFYDKVKITDNHFFNMLQMKRYLNRDDLKLRNKPDSLWPCSPFDVNAYYSILQNSIFLPLGLLQPPFYKMKASPYFNYGALGTLIGHEFAHSLDVFGIEANKYGEITNWWPINDYRKFQTKITCFNESWEMMADTVGFQISYKAYKKLTEYPPLGEFTADQLFSLKFAQNWCELSGKTEFFDDDEHGPSKNRAIRTLIRNNFNEMFNCSLKYDQCYLW